MVYAEGAEGAADMAAVCRTFDPVGKINLHWWELNRGVPGHRQEC